MLALATMALPKRNPRFVAGGFKTSFGKELPMPKASEVNLSSNSPKVKNDHIIQWAIQTGAISVDAEKGLVFSGLRTRGIPHVVTSRNRRGYTRTRLCTPWGTKTISVARAVAISAFGMPHGERDEVNHKNGIRHDDRAANLEWVTNRENIRHAHASGLAKVRTGERSPAAKYPTHVVQRAFTMCQSGASIRDACNATGLSYGYVWELVRGRKGRPDASPEWAARVRKALGVKE